MIFERIFREFAKVVDIQDLIRMKQNAGRDRDINDIKALKKILEMKNNGKI